MGGGASQQQEPQRLSSKEDVEDIIRRTSLKEMRSSLHRKFSSLHSGCSVGTSSPNLNVPGKGSENVQSSRTSLTILEDAIKTDKSILRKFNVLGGANGDIRLDNKQVLVLVKWLVRLSVDTKRNETIISLFTNCLDAEDEGLDYDDFCAMYEQIASRVELERVFSMKFEEYDVTKKGQLDKVDTIAITVYILTNFAPIWCSKREIVEIKKKMQIMIDSFPGECVSRLELLEVYDTMLISMRLIHSCKLKYKELGTDADDQVEEKDIMVMAMWMFKAYQRSGIRFADEDLARIKEQLLTAHRESQDQPVTINELATILEGVKEKKRGYYVLSRSATIPHRRTSRTGRVMMRRLSTHRFLDISPTQQEEIGISPIVREKFDELDTAKKGYISKPAVLELLHWMYLNRPEEEELFAVEIAPECEGIDVDFDEFCSMFDDASLRIDQRKLFEKAFRERSRDGKLPYADLEGFLDAFMFDAEKMGCSVADRDDVKARLLAPFRSAVFTEGCTKEVLSDLYEEACSVIRMLKHASKKFKELDTDGSGALSGSELIALAEWYLQTHNQGSLAAKPSETELNKMRDKFMERFQKSPGGEVTLREMALIHEELLETRRRERNALRYKSKVKGLVAELLSYK